MNTISENRGIILMMLSIFSFTVNTLAARALPMTHQAMPNFTLPAAGLMLLAGFIGASRQLRMTFAYRQLKILIGASIQLRLPIATGFGA